MPRTPDRSPGAKLQDRLKTLKPETIRTGPLWKGPCDPGPLGGITFSMLSRFLSCRERFRVQYVEGIKPAERFNHRTDYGTMWHLCEESLAAHPDLLDNDDWVEEKLRPYCENLVKKFPLDREHIVHWYEVCRTQFPVYVKHWSKHDDVKNRTPLEQEQVFDVPYKLPSGRVVRLRGKRDSADIIDGGIWIQENKTKGDVDTQAIQRQLTFDLQTMGFYLTAMQEDETFWQRLREKYPGKGRKPFPLKGVRYNVVRRPLSGGKGTIVRHKATKNKPEETWEQYYGRVEQVIRESPDHFFARWKTEITPGDIGRFRKECLDPILESLCNWYHQINPSGCLYMPHVPLNWRHPFGAVNIIDEYGAGDVDEYINNGSMTGLRRVDKLFEELV